MITRCCIVSLFTAFSAFAAPVTPAPKDVASLIARVESAQPSIKSEFDALTLTALMEKLHVPGVSIAVVNDFKLHWAKAYGVTDVASERPINVDTRFQAASISKPVSAMAAMRMVQEGQLSLDTDINTYLTSWKVPNSQFTRRQPVTARSLLSHTSGADDGFGFPGYEPQAALPSVVQILNGQAPSNVGKVLFARAPYSAFKYSGGGLLIMQQAMMDICHCAFEKLVHTNVLAPLQMTNSSFEFVSEQHNVAFAHDEEGRRMPAPWHVYPELAAASLWTTPSDLAKFIIEIQTALREPKAKVLQRQFATDMITPVGVGRYGVGLVIEQHGQDWYFSHNGANWGYRAWMTGHFRKGYGMVIMANGDNGMALLNQVADRIGKAYDWYPE